jgi:hypothetical protein
METKYPTFANFHRRQSELDPERVDASGALYLDSHGGLPIKIDISEPHRPHIEEIIGNHHTDDDYLLRLYPDKSLNILTPKIES